MNKFLILVVFIGLGQSYSFTQDSLVRAQLEIFEAYERYDLKNNWAQVVELVRLSSQEKPIDLTQLLESTGDYPFAYVKQENKQLVDSVINTHVVKALLPSNLFFVWSIATEKRYGGGTYYSLHSCKLSADSSSVLNGSHIKKAEAGFSETNQTNIITLTMTAEGTALWTKVTTKNLNRALVIVINNKVLSAPKVYSAITDEITEISGVFTKEEAEAYATAINSGRSNIPGKNK